jgi:hypothetical protein
VVVVASSQDEYNQQVMRRLSSTIGGRLPKGWGDAGRQLGLFVLADLGYELVRGIAQGKTTTAFANTAKIIDFERATGTFFEPAFQQLLIPEQWLIGTLNWMYLNTHFVVTTSFLVWLYLFRNDSFYFVRNMFMVAMGIALVGYTLFPAAPPRLTVGHGFVDTIQDISNVNQDSDLFKILVNPYAAVPSMHIAFSLMIGIPAFRISKHRLTKAFWCAYPAIVFVVIVGTANHFWLDAAAGAVVAGLSAAAAHRLLARARPAVWAWRTAVPEQVRA